MMTVCRHHIIIIIVVSSGSSSGGRACVVRRLMDGKDLSVSPIRHSRRHWPTRECRPKYCIVHVSR